MHSALILSAVGLLPIAAGACPTQLPAGLKGSAVGEGVATLGLAMSIMQVEGREPVAAVLDRTAAAWTEAGYAVRRSAASGWDIVSAMSEKCMVTLQLTSRNGSFGYFARGRPLARVPMTPQSAGMPVPDGAAILSAVESDDDGRKGLTVAMTSSRSLDELHQFFTQRLTDAKWGAVRAQKLVAGKTGATSLLLRAQRRREQIAIVVWPDRQTQVVMTVSSAL